MILEMFATFLVRAAQVLAAAMPTILLGMLSAGVLVRVIGGERVRRWIGGATWSAAARAWLMGILLPVCPLGVIPVLVTLYRMRVGCCSLAIIALSGPLVTPWTIGYLADRTGWPVALALLVANGVIALAVSIAFGTGRSLAQANEDEPAAESTVLLGTLVAAGRSVTRGATLAILAAVAGAGAVAMFIPPNAVGEWLVERSAAHAVVLAAISMLTVVLPTTLALHAGEIARGSTMPGMLAVMVALAGGVNAGVILLFTSFAGIRRTMLAAVVGLCAALVIGLAFDQALRDPAYAPEDSHAFEDLGRPFHLLDHPDGPVAGWWHRFTRVVGIESAAAAAGVIVLLAAARARYRPVGAKPPAPVSSSALRWMGASACTGLVIAIVYTYYPTPDAAAREIARKSAELLSSDSPDESKRLRRSILHRLGQLDTAAMLYGRPLGADERDAVKRLQQVIPALEPSGAGPLSEEQAGAIRDVGMLRRLAD